MMVGKLLDAGKAIQWDDVDSIMIRVPKLTKGALTSSTCGRPVPNVFMQIISADSNKRSVKA